jgi:hypothetical protein
VFHGIDFIFIAIGVSIVLRAARGLPRFRNLPPQPQPAMLEDPRVGQLQGEVDELRAQVERLKEAERFYAQLQAPAAPKAEAPAQ